jgi:hypothetical protein
VRKSGAPQTSKADEYGYLAGSFAELGTLLLAYYFPQVYEAAIKRAESKRVPLDQGIKELVGLSPLELSLEVIEALELPPFYKDILQAAVSGKASSAVQGLPNERIDIERIASSVKASRNIATVIVSSKNRAELDRVLEQTKASLDIPGKLLEQVVGDLPEVFKKQCDSIELSLPALPAYIAGYLESAKGDSAKPKEADEFSQYVDEIRQAVESGESTASVVTTVMETLAWNLKFDRVLLLLVVSGKRKLSGRMLLGSSAESLDAKSIERTIDSRLDTAPDITAFKEGRPIFQGEPLLPNGWPLVAIPVGFGQRAIGVIYADRLPPNDKELSAREQAAISVLAELLDRSVSLSA